MTDEVVIPGRFNGPPGSANGGYACGTTAALLDGAAQAGAAVEVTLRRPPPLDRPLAVVRRDGSVEVRDGDEVVAEAHPAELELDLPDPVPAERAQRAAATFDTADYTRRHPFPRCFTCGPAREEGDGLRIFPAQLGDGGSLVAWPWTPAGSLADATGLIQLPVIWAALDCPSGLARFTSDARTQQTDAVLGRMTAAVHRRPSSGEPTVAAGWAISDEGRRLLSGSALWSAEGELLAAARTVWIVLSPQQRAGFGIREK